MASSAVTYLESHEYEHYHRPAGIRDNLFEYRDDDLLTGYPARGLPPRGYSARTGETHADWLCDMYEEDLCTGDGFRWRPGDPVARFP